MGNGCSDKEADLSCLDRKPRKKPFLKNDPFLKDRNYTVKQLFEAIEEGCSKKNPDFGKFQIWSDKDPESLRMNDEIKTSFNGKEGKISAKMFIDFCQTLGLFFDV